LPKNEPIVTSRMVFVEYATDVDASAVLGSQVSDESSKELAAAGFLVRQLAGGDWQESAPLKTAASSDGISERTLQRAKLDLGVEDKREGFPAISYWRLPQSRQPSYQSDGATTNGAWLSQNERDESLVAPAPLGGTTDAERARLFDELYPTKAGRG